MPAATVTPAARVTVCVPPVAVSVVVLVVAATVGVTSDDCDAAKSAGVVGTNVARNGWSPLTRSVRVKVALPETTGWVPTTTPLSVSCTVPAGVPEDAVTPAVRVADRPETTEDSVVVVLLATGAVPAHSRVNGPTPAADVR